MIEDGYITRDEYEGYINQMHERMRSCFDSFLPEVVPNNVIEQYAVRQGDIFFMCCDGLSDWITPNYILAALTENGIKNGIDKLIPQAKGMSLASLNYFDDITAVAVQCC